MGGQALLSSNCWKGLEIQRINGWETCRLDYRFFYNLLSGEVHCNAKSLVV